MEAGNVKEFVNNLTIQDEMVRYDGHLYYFYGIRYDSNKNVYYTSIDMFGEDIHHFEKEFYYYESSDLADCLEHLLLCQDLAQNKMRKTAGNVQC